MSLHEDAMRKLLICAAALLLAGSVAAKDWKDGATSFHTGDGQPYTLVDEGLTVKCKIHSWPVNSPVAVLDCDDGKKREMETIAPDSIAIDGHLLAPIGN